MKKIIYVALFTFLGFLLQLILHAVFEQWYISLLLKDFETFGFGLSWDEWFLVHHFLSVLLAIAGMLLGFWQGRHWYKIIYPVRNSSPKDPSDEGART